MAAMVKRTGNGSIIEFRSVVDAAKCALSVQRSGVALPDATARPPTIVLEFGINLGDVIFENDDLAAACQTQRGTSDRKGLQRTVCATCRVVGRNLRKGPRSGEVRGRRRALSLNPNSSLAYASLGSIRMFFGQPLEAISARARHSSRSRFQATKSPLPRRTEPPPFSARTRRRDVPDSSAPSAPCAA